MEATLARPIALAATCRHCGDPCAAGEVTSGHGTFCCDGCAAVFALLADRGLDGFYACDVAPGTSQRAAATRAADRVAALDDPAVAARVLLPGDGALACAQFDVPALHCASCVWLLERLWKVDDGIVRAEADLLRRTVQVWFRRDHVSLRAVAERLAAIGYEPAVARETPRPGAIAPATRRLYLQLGLAGFAAGNMMLFSVPRYANGAPLDPAFQHLFDGLNLALATPVLVFSAADWLRGAWRALAAGRLTLDVPVALGLLALYARSVADIASGTGPGFLDAFAGLVFFLLVGRLFQQKAFDRIAFDRTWRSFLPLTVRVSAGKGGWQPTPLDQVRPGDHVLLRPQEIVPADARLLDAAGTIDYAFVTGESTPVTVIDGELVRAGGRVVGRALRLVVMTEVQHTALARLWQHPAFTRTAQPWLTDVAARFGAWFTAATLLVAVAGAAAWWPNATMAAQVASAVLIIACPCALTLAAPVTLGTAMGIAGRAGLFLKQPAVDGDDRARQGRYVL
jgi:Cu+-exporting ATPase